jgi:hypothetical protein
MYAIAKIAFNDKLKLAIKYTVDSRFLLNLIHAMNFKANNAVKIIDAPELMMTITSRSRI